MYVVLASVIEDKVKIGDNLRIVRESRGLTQEQLAEKWMLINRRYIEWKKVIILWKHFWQQC